MMATVIKFTLVPQWDFEDYKGWAIMLGTREEGQLVWRDGSSKDPDFDYKGYRIMMARDEGNEGCYMDDEIYDSEMDALGAAAEWLVKP